MNNLQFHSLLVLAAALALMPRARADETSSHIAFSDPAKPGTLRVRIWHGEVSIHGGDVKEITIKSESAAMNPTPRDDGMRVLSATAGFTLGEKANVAVLEYGSDGWTGGSADFDITVPRNTSIVVSNTVHGDFECDGISGDIDVRSMGGDIRLKGISGGALVEAMRGDISVDVQALTPGHPLSFTSMRGGINLRLPADAKADVRFRTHRGLILTNFDDKALVTKTEVSQVPEHKDKDRDKDMVKASAASDDSDSDSDWHADVRDSIKEAAVAAADAAREATEAVHEGLMEAHLEMAGFPAPLPPMTGGKVVDGTLNGGGVEVHAATLNGDIKLKKAE